MFSAKGLAEEFAAHVRSCPSGFIACTVRVAAEAWFQVELAHMMHSRGQLDSVQFGYDYPGGAQGMKFSELIRLLEGEGFQLLKEKGSIRYYSKPGVERLIRVDYHGSKEVPRELARRS